MPAGSHLGSSLVKHCLVYMQALLKDVEEIGEEGYRDSCIQSVLAEDNQSVEHLAAVEGGEPPAHCKLDGFAQHFLTAGPPAPAGPAMMEVLTELCQENKLTGIYVFSQPNNVSKKQLKSFLCIATLYL